MTTSVHAIAAVPAVTAPAAGPRFGGLVRGELRKIVRQRANWLILSIALAGALVGGLAFSAYPAFATALRSNPAEWFHGVAVVFGWIATTDAGILLLVLSARLVGMEYSAGTIRVVLARGVGRLQLLAAKLAALGLAAVALIGGFAAFGAAFVGAMILANGGSLSVIASLGWRSWHELALQLVAAAISMTICILLGAAAGAVGRSLTFALAVAIGFFPADNFVNVVCTAVDRATNRHAWAAATSLLLGANLNLLPEVLTQRRESFFPRPPVRLDAAHVLIVAGAYAAAFLAVAVLTTWRRDVVE